MVNVLCLEKEIARVFEAVSQEEKNENPAAIKKIERLKKQLLLLKAVLTSSKRRTSKEGN